MNVHVHHHVFPLQVTQTPVLVSHGLRPRKVKRGQSKPRLSLQKKLEILWAGLQHPRGVKAYCQENGVSEQSYYRWKRQFDAELASADGNAAESEGLVNTTQISELVQENQDLKRLVAQLYLEKMKLEKKLQSKSSRCPTCSRE